MRHQVYAKMDLEFKIYLINITNLLLKVNRDPMAAEMRHMRQQVELLQAELLCIREGGSFEEIQVPPQLDRV